MQAACAVLRCAVLRCAHHFKEVLSHDGPVLSHSHQLIIRLAGVSAQHTIEATSLTQNLQQQNTSELEYDAPVNQVQLLAACSNAAAPQGPVHTQPLFQTLQQGRGACLACASGCAHLCECACVDAADAQHVVLLAVLVKRHH